MKHGELLKKLRGALNAEIEQYRELLNTCRKQREAMLSGDAQEMQICMQEQQEIVTGCRSVSSVRLAFLGELSRELGLGEPHSLTRLLALLPEEAGDIIREKTETMRGLSADIKMLTERIFRLSEHRLDLLQGDFNAMLRIVQRAAGEATAAGAGSQGTLVSTQA
jgi:hypothetical protein